jgi:hypothetical protein
MTFGRRCGTVRYSSSQKRLGRCRASGRAANQFGTISQTRTAEHISRAAHQPIAATAQSKPDRTRSAKRTR